MTKIINKKCCNKQAYYSRGEESKSIKKKLANLTEKIIPSSYFISSEATHRVRTLKPFSMSWDKWGCSRCVSTISNRGLRVEASSSLVLMSTHSYK